MASERPLLLHVSALSPDEYESYTAVLAELAGPGHGESQWNKSVGVMEARGWLRGRYGLDAVLVDKILRYFVPGLGQSETLSASQFFAVMRLVQHAQSGRDPAKTLVFVQANIPQSLDRRSPSPHNKRLSVSAKKASMAKLPPAPPTPARPRNLPDSQATEPSTDIPLPPPPSHPPLNPNPFRRGSQSSEPAILDKSHAERSMSPPVAPPIHPLSRSVSMHAKPTNTNPFAPRNTIAVPQSNLLPTSPPLPPRKPPTLPPRAETFIVTSAPPRIPPKPSTNKPSFPPLTTSLLMKESLRAAKSGQAHKANEHLLEKTLNWDVIGRSGSRDSNQGGSSSEKATGNGRDAIHTHHRSGSHRRAPSPPASASSVNVIASARHQSSSSRSQSSKSTSSVSPSRSAPARVAYPPIYEDLKSSRQGQGAAVHRGGVLETNIDHPTTTLDEISPGRIGRSHSFNDPSSALTAPNREAPLPPPRRRPESIQVLSNSNPLYYAYQQQQYSSPTHPPPITTPYNPATSPGLSRRTSIQQQSRNVYDSVKKKAEEFQPRVSDFRKKAEGRVVPGGYTKLGGGEGTRLVDSDEGDDGKDAKKEADGRRRLPSEDSSSDDEGDGGEGMAGADVSVDGDDWSEWDRAKSGGGTTVSNSNSGIGSSLSGYALDPRIRTRGENGELMIHAPTPQPIRAEGWMRL